jgi:prepilin-type N-terminal cleavage/methylation domain-containing protein
MKKPPERICKGGLTLIEVMLSLAIIAILSITTLVAIPYARYLTCRSAAGQSAIHAGSSDIERQLHDYMNSPGPAAQSDFSTDGWTNRITSYAAVKTNFIYGEEYHCLVISNTVTYRDGKTVDLVTYRSLEVPGNRR